MTASRHTTTTLAASILSTALAVGTAVHHLHTPVPARFMPDPALTPGKVLHVNAEQCCTKGYAGATRDVTQATKNEVYRRYGIKHHQPGEYEIDHLISLELGGDNAIENLWPQPYGGTWNAHLKDALENRLHKLVCDGEITLHEAQQAIRSDWIEAYEKYISH